MNAPYLPPVARAPHDPRSRVLDARLGWAALALPGVTGGMAQDPADGALALAPLPGTGRLLAEPGGGFGGLVLPRHAVQLADGTLVLLDGAQGRLWRLDRCACRLAPWPCLDAGGLRVPAGAAGLGAGCGELYVALPALQRVLVIEAANGALRAAWPSPPLVPPLAPPGAPPWAPVHAIGVDGGLVAVGDAARGGVHLCSRRGHALRFIGGLGAVRALAADRSGRLYVQRDGDETVAIIELASGRLLGHATRPGEVARRFAPLGLPTAPAGAIDLGPLCEPPADTPHWFGPDGQAQPAPAPALPAYPAAGRWISGPIDSGEHGCTWDRVALVADLPPGTRVRVFATAADALLTDAELADPSRWHGGGEWKHPGDADALRCAPADWMLASTSGRHGWLKLELAGDTRTTPRVHCVQLDFARISLRRYLPAVFGADPVAAEFTDRWLAVFDRGLREIEAEVDEQARLFDPLAAPEAFVRFIAAWVGVVLPSGWPLAQQRRVLAAAPALYPWRGTRAGLAAALSLLLGLDRWSAYRPPNAACVPCATGLRQAARWRAPRLLLEHHQLRRWMATGHARLSDAAKLWGERIVNRSRLDADFPLTAGGGSGGAQLGVTQLLTVPDPRRDPFHVHAHRLSVFVPAGCVAAPGRREALQRFIEAELPAHTQARLVVVQPRFRVGVQAMLGLDAVIGVRTRAPVLDDADTPLGRATVLPAAGTAFPEPPRGAGRQRVGLSTVIR